MNEERDINLEFKLLLGKPILIEQVGYLYPLTINEIDNIGLINYYQMTSLLVCNEEEIKRITNNICLTTMDYLIQICLADKESKKIILDFLTTLFKEEVYLHNVGFFCLGEEKNLRIIDLESYEKIKKTIRLQNCIKEEEKKSEKVKEFEARLAKLRKKYKKDNDTTIIEIISAISAKHPSLNLLNIGQLTIYQLYDQLSRLNMIESYQFNFEALLNGASKDDVGINKHWSSRIDK